MALNHYALVSPEGWVMKWASTDNPDGPGEFEGLVAVPMDVERPPPRPYEGAKLTLVEGELVWVDHRTIEDLRALKNAEINAARLAANQSSFTYSGKQIAVDALSRSDIDAANGIITLTGALPPGWPGAWKAMDNSYVPITDLATWAAFYGAMVAAGTTNFTHAQTLKAAVLAAETVEEIDAISW